MRRFATIIGLMLLAPLFSACAGTDVSGLNPQPGRGIASVEAQRGDGGVAGSSASQAAAPMAQEGQTVAAVSTDARVQFAPVIGATEEALPPLSSRLSARARQRGIPITQGAGATHVVKGYFSAIADGNETTVIYVWDVLDPSGNRLHRIQGQQKVPGGEGDGWSSVTGQTMETIADRTVDDLAAWLTRDAS
ncbi:hypothetical protein [Chelativorans salis]|uniref:Lipoprotein n=1 Tax=Chelativorans salis TaxID=2978478 RepID=A0ABT2LJR7_9HYPH|nr:hypothetical protein [Chelativorans sp. EGI FJ00035]MCT7374805.1 hypothetical protein [Chelativorans sp. EGI FJ00035]